MFCFVSRLFCHYYFDLLAVVCGFVEMICLFCVCVFILLLEFVQCFVALGVIDLPLFGFDVTGMVLLLVMFRVLVV